MSRLDPCFCLLTKRKKIKFDLDNDLKEARENVINEGERARPSRITRLAANE